MIKKIFVLLGIFFLTSLSAQAENTLTPLWDIIKTDQTQGLPDGLSGGWLEEIIVQGQPKVLFSDLSPFSALQIMLRLESIYSHIDLAGYQEVKNKFKGFVDYYLNHRLKDEPYGSIGFWPVWQLEDGTLIRAPYNDPNIRKIVGDSLPADTDDSSQMAIWLQKTDPSHPFIKAYLNMLKTVLDENRSQQSKREAAWKDINSGAFLTWVRQSANDVDCVVNINILTSLSVIKKFQSLSNKLLQAEKAASALIFEVLNQSKMPLCTYYYSRWSQFYLALGKLHEEGGGVFTADQWQIIRTEFKKTVLKNWNVKTEHAAGEWSEFLIAARMLGLSEDNALKPVLVEIREYLLEKVRNNNYYSLIEGSDVFHGQVRSNMKLLWFVKAQTATFLLEALS